MPIPNPNPNPMHGPVLLAGVAVALVAAGCSSADREADRLRAANTINYGSFGATAGVDCGDGKTLNIAGSNNIVTISGRCESVEVSGADNTITVERVDGELSVSGLNNAITYRSGEPSVRDSGSGNTINGG